MRPRKAAHVRMEEKLIPDFDTRTPQEPDEPNRLRNPLIAYRLRALLTTTKRRIQSIANGLRSLVLANKVRTSLLGGVILLLVGPAFTVGLPLYSSSGKGNWQPGVLDGTPHAQIVFGPGDSGLWAMSADGSNQSRLLGSTAVDPDWSPDGKKIAFARIVEESTAASATPESIPSIVVMNADGSGQRELLDAPASDPAWSPDGKKIAFSKSTPGGLSSIYVMNADGSGDPKRLTTERGARDTDPAWSPDGTKIAFQSTRPGTPEPLPLPPNQTGSLLSNTEIYVIDACCEEGDTNKPQPLTGSIGWNADPAWSPDGTEIAFTYMSFRHTCRYGCETVVRTTDVYKMDADGCDKRRLTPADPDNGHPEQGPAWSPDGKQIAYVRGSTASSAIYKIDSDGSDPTSLGKFPTASSAGSKLDWVGTTAGRDGIVEQEASDQGANAECTEKAGEEKQGIVAPPEDETPKAYMKQINELLQENDLRGSEAGSEVRRQARTKTLRVLEESGTSEKEKVVRFLAGAGLIQSVAGKAPTISLVQAELGGVDLRGTHLSGADLANTNLSGADLSKADLSGASLVNANLSNAKLNGTDLRGADVRATATHAELRDANLTDANLWGADLTHADLQGAELQGADLREATLRGANITMPDEFNARVPAWEAAARGQLKDLYATLTSCLDTIQVKKWDPHVSSEAIRENKVLRCTETSHDEGFKRYVGDLRPNVGWSMHEQTHRVGNASYGTGEVIITAQHSFGGSAYQTSTATNGRIERIPRF
jgi:Tol biopolymer transport system component/uncharacterized protein YjbI with pentapeptide repeats